MRTNRDITLVFRGRRFEIPKGASVYVPPGRPSLRYLANIELFIDPVTDERRYKDAIADGIELHPRDVEEGGDGAMTHAPVQAAPTKHQRAKDGTTFGAVDVGQPFWDPQSATWMRKSSRAEATIIGAETHHPDLVEFRDNEAVVSVIM